MQDYQKKNDAKYEFYSNYRGMESYRDAAKRDEQTMIKQMAERDAKAQMDDIARREKDNQLKSLATRALDEQIRAKELQKMLSRQTDALYADQVQRNNTMQDNQDREKYLEKQRAKQDYFNSLNA